MTDIRNAPTATRDSTPTAALGTAVAGTRFDSLPPYVITLARLCFLDVLGTMVAGSREPAAETVAAFAASETDHGPCTLVGRAATAPPTYAALVNGTAGHALDFDDVMSRVGHPSVAIAPAALAVGQRVGSSGRALLTAFVAGVETYARTADAVGPSHYARGFHTTATLGSFGAAAAVSRVLGLDATGVTTALGIAGTLAAGLKVSFGTMCKPLHAGRAAANGVTAGELAARGLTAAHEILGAPQGFAAAQSDAFDAALLPAEFGAPWRTADMSFKVHAACFLTHASIDALVSLRREHGFTADDVEHVTVTVPPGHLSVCAIPEPVTGLEGKFSLRLTAALALLRQAAGPELFTDAMVVAPEVVAVRDRVEVRTDDALSGPAARVDVALAGGRLLAGSADLSRPAWHDTPDELTGPLLAKFHQLAGPVLGEPRARELAEAALHLDELADVGDLGALAALT